MVAIDKFTPGLRIQTFPKPVVQGKNPTACPGRSLVYRGANSPSLQNPGAVKPCNAPAKVGYGGMILDGGEDRGDDRMARKNGRADAESRDSQAHGFQSFSPAGRHRKLFLFVRNDSVVWLLSFQCFVQALFDDAE